MLVKLFWAVVLFGLGLGLIVYTVPFKRFTGSVPFAEKHLGPGGTYTLYKILGILVIIVTILWLTGTIDRIIPDILVGSPATGTR